MAIELSEVGLSGPTAIDGYGPGGFRIGGDWIGGAVFLTPKVLTRWPVTGIPDLSGFEALREVLAGLDVVLVGFGAGPRMVSAEVQGFFDDLGVGVEPMATPPACRTYNVLLNEGRHVGVALLPL